MYLNNLFSEEKVNTGRQAELDIAKTLSIILLEKLMMHILKSVISIMSSYVNITLLGVTYVHNLQLGELMN